MVNHGQYWLTMVNHGGMVNLVGGLEPWNFMAFHILGRIIPTDELIFFKGAETTNQSN